MKDWLFPLFFLIALFADNILFSYLFLTGTMIESGMMTKMILPIALISYVIFLRDFPKLMGVKSNMIVIFSLVVIGGGYFITSVFQNGLLPAEHWSHFMRFCSICVAASIIGMHAGNHSSCLEKIDTLLPFFVVFTGVVIGSLGLRVASAGEMVSREEYGMSYQRIAYLMAEIFAYSVYYLFFSTARNTKLFIIMKWVMTFMLFFSIFGCLISGGRGAFVTMVVLSVFVAYTLKRSRRISTITLVTLAIVATLVITYLMVKFNATESAGFLRITERFTDDSGRYALYEKAFSSIERSSYMGSGLGAVWWEVGFYSHNMFLDMLVEIGAVGTIIVLYVFYFIAKRLYLLCKTDMKYMLVLLIFLQNLVHTAFSSYWISTYQLWLAYGFVMAAIGYQKRLKYKVRPQMQ